MKTEDQIRIVVGIHMSIKEEKIHFVLCRVLVGRFGVARGGNSGRSSTNTLGEGKAGSKGQRRDGRGPKPGDGGK